jgi:hypothetical protein
VKYVLFALAPLVLAGCGTTKGLESVNIPIAVACKASDPNQPTYRFAPPYTSVFEATRDLLGDREAALAYENELRAALKSCK